MIVRIPIDREIGGAAFFDLQVTLEGVTYTLEFRWNVRLGAWFMAVLDAQGTTAHLVGLRLVADSGLVGKLAGRTPPGLFVVVDTGAVVGMGEDPGFDDLGSRVQLFYASSDELA